MASQLDEALESLRHQTHSNIQILISDNASTDNTQEICLEHAAHDSRIQYHRQNNNLGAVGNFKFVLSKANSPYFMWAAGDDLWSPNWIESLLSLIQGTDRVGAFGKVCQIESQGKAVPAMRSHDRTFTWTDLQSRGARLSRFVSQPESGGKANIIYGLYTSAALTDVAEAAFSERFPNSDNNVVFGLLAKGRIGTSADCYFFKRLSKTEFSAVRRPHKWPRDKKAIQHWTNLRAQLGLFGRLSKQSFGAQTPYVLVIILFRVMKVIARQLTLICISALMRVIEKSKRAILG